MNVSELTDTGKINTLNAEQKLEHTPQCTFQNKRLTSNGICDVLQLIAQHVNIDAVPMALLMEFINFRFFKFDFFIDRRRKRENRIYSIRKNFFR